MRPSPWASGGIRKGSSKPWDGSVRLPPPHLFFKGAKNMVGYYLKLLLQRISKLKVHRGSSAIFIKEDLKQMCPFNGSVLREARCVFNMAGDSALSPGHVCVRACVCMCTWVCAWPQVWTETTAVRTPRKWLGSPLHPSPATSPLQRRPSILRESWNGLLFGVAVRHTTGRLRKGRQDPANNSTFPLLSRDGFPRVCFSGAGTNRVVG